MGYHGLATGIYWAQYSSPLPRNTCGNESKSRGLLVAVEALEEPSAAGLVRHGGRQVLHPWVISLGADSPFFSTIGLSKKQSLSNSLLLSCKKNGVEGDKRGPQKQIHRTSLLHPCEPAGE